LASQTQAGSQPSRTRKGPQLGAGDVRAAGRRRALWVGFLAVFIPLIVMLVLQYRWLANLQSTSNFASTVFMQKYLEGVVKEVHYEYATIAERTLNLPPSIFDPEKIHKTGYYFQKHHKGARELFVVSFSGSWGKEKTQSNTLFYDRKTRRMYKPAYKPDFHDSMLAVWAATAPWKIMATKGGAVDTTLSVDQRDPNNRIILNPITDESGQLVGLAGMIVDEKFFVKQLLPKAIKASDFKKVEGLVVGVRDGNGHLVLPHDDQVKGLKRRAAKSFSFIFTDWKIYLLGDISKHEEWARTNFAINMTQSVVLGFVLLGGIVLALRTASRELKLSMMKNDFVSNVSHELRTPLSSIRVFGEFMRRGRVTEQAKIREYGEYIESESRRLTQLINNILDFSRIESGQKVYSFEEADIEDVVTSALTTCAVRLRSKGFNIEFHGPEEPVPLMTIDAGAIDRAVCNLLDNAAKYSADGREILVRLEPGESEVTISVEDQGIGISKEEQKRIFDRFHRVSTGLVHDVKGSGLGLAIVQHIAQAHGGKVTVRSELGKGSTFSIVLPVRGDTDEPAGQSSSDQERGSKR
jgi:signal transduction histidine kinase